MFRDTVLDILFPPTCVVCEEDGAWLCESCRSHIFLETHGVEKTEQEPWPFCSVITVGSYANPRLRLPLTQLKYHAASCLEQDLKALLRVFRQNFLDPWPWAGLSEMLITSIPGDRRRMRERGMDHGTLLAHWVRDILVPWAEPRALLRRTRSTMPNARLPANAIRAANLFGAFEATEKITVPVMIVDDVLTTGATASEAARTLIAAGAPEVHLFVFAKG